MDNVIFIGMPAVGKSTVGVVVAKRLGYRFLDVDILIQETEGKLLREIIRENGIGGFLEIEDRINAGVCAELRSFRREEVSCTVKMRWSITKRLEASYICRRLTKQ